MGVRGIVGHTIFALKIQFPKFYSVCFGNMKILGNFSVYMAMQGFLEENLAFFVESMTFRAVSATLKLFWPCHFCPYYRNTFFHTPNSWQTDCRIVREPVSVISVYYFLSAYKIDIYSSGLLLKLWINKKLCASVYYTAVSYNTYIHRIYQLFSKYAAYIFGANSWMWKRDRNLHTHLRVFHGSTKLTTKYKNRHYQKKKTNEIGVDISQRLSFTHFNVSMGH